MGPTSGHSSLALRAVAVGAVLLAVAGCRSAPTSKPLSQLTPLEMRGHEVFQNNCAGCHYANSDSAMVGPGLQGVFKRQYLPSGAPANDDRVRATVLAGRGMMPAFGNVLDEQQMQALLAYLHTL